MIDLYIREGCRYCGRVINRIGELNLEKGTDYTLIDAAPNTPGRTLVLEKGGRGQVPFMIDNDVHMYESGDIVNYIEAKFSK